MGKNIQGRIKRISSGFLAVCMFSMAVFPHGNISYANTEGTDTVLKVVVPEGETVVKTNQGTVTVVDEESSSPESSSTPSASPDTSTEPSATPSTSVEASTEPSSTPSASPDTSTEPSSTPSASPDTNTEPSSTPSASPDTSTEPSSTPSASPDTSTEPSSTPSASPDTSTEPSSTPSASPDTSIEPSSTPSASPDTSIEPSSTPSASPDTSIEPSSTPSASPDTSTEPTVTPSASPDTSTEPTVTPSASPDTSSEPSSTPSASPDTSIEPIVTPSASPDTSTEPIVTPSASPDTSSEPSSTPSASPDTSTEPSSTPSASPDTSTESTVTPSVSPSISIPSLSTRPLMMMAAAPASSSYSIDDIVLYKNDDEIDYLGLSNTSAYIYAKEEDDIYIEFSQSGFSNMSVKIGNTLVDYSADMGFADYILDSNIDESEIVFDFYEGSTLRYSFNTRIIYDKTLPSVELNLKEGSVSQTLSSIFITPSDNKAINKIYMSRSSAETKPWDYECELPDGWVNGDEFSITVDSGGMYYFYVSDMAGNESSIKSIEIPVSIEHKISNIKVYKNSEEVYYNDLASSSSYIYAKQGDEISVKFTQNGFSDLSVKIGNALTSYDPLTGIAKKVLDANDSEVEIVFDFYEQTSLITSCSTRIRYDRTLPTINLSMIDGTVGSEKSNIYITPTDEKAVNKVYMSLNSSDPKPWTTECVFPDNWENGKTFSKEVTSVGTYYFYVEDMAGNESDIKSIEVGLGNYDIIIKKLPKVNYKVGEEFSLVGGYLKFARTFNTIACTCGSPSCVKICLCKEDCTCAKDASGNCVATGDCQDNDYLCNLIPMENATIVSPIKDQTATPGTIKIQLSYKFFNPVTNKEETDNVSFDIKVVDAFNVNFTPNTFELSEEENKVSIEVTPNGLTGPYYYTWSWSEKEEELGTETYAAVFNEYSDSVFMYEDAIADNGLHWYYDSEEAMYRSGNISYVTNQRITSTKRIVIDTQNPLDTSGEISFEYKTMSKLQHHLEIDINGRNIIETGGESDWLKYTGTFNSVDGKYTIDLLFGTDGVNGPTSENYGAIRNLTFVGEKKWNPLPENNIVELAIEDALYKNNYLFVKGKNSSNEDAIAHSGVFTVPAILDRIEIDTVPYVTAYDVTSGKKVVPDTEGGKVMLIYERGRQKIDMSETDIHVRNIGANTWTTKLDLNRPGVWDVRITYVDEETDRDFFAYYTVTVNYSDDSVISSTSTVNRPELISGMIPVKWVEITRTYKEYELIEDNNSDSSTGEEELEFNEKTIEKLECFWIATTEYDTDWYDYGSAKKWANVMLKDDIKIREVSDPNDSKLDTANFAGKKIDSCGSMFVWIPRFAYTMPNYSTSFGISWSNGTADTSGYTKQGAFTHNGTELTGFWMAKYEASLADDIKDYEIEIKPYRPSNFVGSTVVDAYNYSKDILSNSYYKEYGFNSNTGVLSHLVTMEEWDAIAMLCITQHGLKNIVVNSQYDGVSSYTGYNKDKRVEFNENANSSTTNNMHGIFDMYGGAAEYISAYATMTDAIKNEWQQPSEGEGVGGLGSNSYAVTSFDKITGPDIDVLTFTTLDQYDIFEDILEDMGQKDTWIFNKLYNDFLEDAGYEMYDYEDMVGAGRYIGKVLDLDLVMMLPFEAVVRGSAANYSHIDEKNGYFSTWVVPHSYFSKSGTPVGFRPSILVVSPQVEEEKTIDVSVEVYRDGKATGSSIAGVGDTIVLTLELSKGSMLVDNVLIAGKSPTRSNSTPETAKQKWILEYDVDETDLSGMVNFEFYYKIQNQDTTFNFREGPEAGEDKIYIDTDAEDADLEFKGEEDGTGSIIVTPPEAGTGEAPIDDENIKWTKEDPDNKPAPEDFEEFYKDFFENPDNADKIFPVEDGKINVTQPGNYIIYIKDSAGNVTIQQQEIKDGAGGDDSWEVNSSTPKLESFQISVSKNGVYNSEATYAVKGESIKVDMMFDKELSKQPVVFILKTEAVVTMGDNAKLWTATVEVPNSTSAYLDIPIEIKDFGYHGNNSKEVFTETFDNPSVVAYDGSFVIISAEAPKLYNKTGGSWGSPVTNLESGKPIAIEYEIEFKDSVFSRDNTSVVGDNLDTNSISIDPAKHIKILGGMTADISVQEVAGEPNKRIIRFENVSGSGDFAFSIAGATDTTDLNGFTNFVAKDIYGNPNKYFELEGEVNIPSLDNTLPEITELEIFSSNSIPNMRLYAKNGHKITINFTVSEQLSGLPTVLIFGNSASVTKLSSGKYMAEYNIPLNATFNEGFIPFSISNYVDYSGNTGPTITQNDLLPGENVLYDRTKPNIAVMVNDLPSVITVTLSDTSLNGATPSGVLPNPYLEYFWSETPTLPLDFEWSLANVNNNIIDVPNPDKFVHAKYLIIKGVSDNAGNVSDNFVSDRYIRSSLVISEPSVDITNIEAVSYIVTYFEAETIDLRVDDVVLNTTGNAIGSANVGSVVDNGDGTKSVQVTISNIVGDGTIGITIKPETSKSITGFSDIDGAGPSSTFVVDNTMPEIIFTPTNAEIASTDFSVKMDIKDPVKNDVAVGLTTNTQKYAWSLDLANPPAAGEWIDFDLVDGVANIPAPSETGYWYLWIKAVEDRVGNITPDTVSGAYIIDIVKPIITVDRIYTNNRIPTVANNTDVITIEMTCNKSLETAPTVTINCLTDVRNMTVTGSEKHWVATYKVPDDETAWIDETVLGYSISDYVCASGYVGDSVIRPNSGIKYKYYYEIKAYAGSNGTITPEGSVKVRYAEDKRFNISPNNGYKIKNVTVDGVSMGAITTYLFENIKGDHTIHVTFEKDDRYDNFDGDWYYDHIELTEGEPEYVFRSKAELDEFQDASAIIEIETKKKVTVSFEYLLNARSDAIFGFSVNGKPIKRVISSANDWTEFTLEATPVNGKVLIGLTYSKGDNLATGESYLDLAAIKNLDVK